MTRGVLALAAVAVLGCRAGDPPPPSARPDIVLVTIDTLRADHTSAYGYARPTTPVLAALAREGALVEQAYAPTATTAPSHATMLTAAYPWSHGVLKNGNVLDGAWETAAERLRGAGYATAAVVSTYVLKSEFGFAQGFETFEQAFDPATASLDGERRRMPERARNRRADATTDLALQALGRRDRGRPFFLWVHYFDPHDPYWAPPPHTDRFLAPEQGERERAIARYDGEVAFVDAQLGRLLETLDPARTLVAVTADHGEGFWEHGYLGHGLHLYEEAVRVPLVFRWPGRVAAGGRLPGPVEQVDIAPTLLELAGVPWSGPTAQGQSLAAALGGAGGGAGRDGRRPVFLQRRAYAAETTRDGGVEVAGPKFAVRLGSAKYIEASEELSRELYDLERDPGETKNLMDHAAQEGDRLAALLQRWRQKHRQGAKAREDVSAETDEALRSLGYVR